MCAAELNYCSWVSILSFCVDKSPNSHDVRTHSALLERSCDEPIRPASHRGKNDARVQVAWTDIIVFRQKGVFGILQTQEGIEGLAFQIENVSAAANQLKQMCLTLLLQGEGSFQSGQLRDALSGLLACGLHITPQFMPEFLFLFREF